MISWTSADKAVGAGERCTRGHDDGEADQLLSHHEPAAASIPRPCILRTVVQGKIATEPTRNASRSSAFRGSLTLAGGLSPLHLALHGLAHERHSVLALVEDDRVSAHISSPCLFQHAPPGVGDLHSRDFHLA
jgi:hypothetical protein